MNPAEPRCTTHAAQCASLIDALRLRRTRWLLFEEGERGPSDDLRLQFEAVSHMPEEERHIVKALLEGRILKYQTKQMVNNLSS
ncbi:hypothetical protein ACTSKR_05520 [Chitinibacteraceae bacterium HSL-7]